MNTMEILEMRDTFERNLTALYAIGHVDKDEFLSELIEEYDQYKAYELDSDVVEHKYLRVEKNDDIETYGDYFEEILWVFNTQKPDTIPITILEV